MFPDARTYPDSLRVVPPMNTIIDNDFLDIQPPTSFGEWSPAERALMAARYWNAVGDEVDHALIRDIGSARWAEFTEELFRVHQREFFVSGCEALGIADVKPDTKKCVLYHCMSTALGGTRSRYAIESDSKAWIFYLPNTMASGGAVLGNEAHLAAFKGWYANNGPALGNDGLRFVVTHLLSRGDPYDSGYFIDEGVPVALEDRCRVEFGAQPPVLSERRAASFDPETWPEERRMKALRNFALGWAWDRIVGAGSLLGDAGVAGVRHAFEIAVNAYLPYFAAAIGGSGPEMAGRYYAAVHEIAGFRVTTTEMNPGLRVQLSRDPLAQSSFQLSDEMAAATHDCIREAWAVMTADHGVRIEGSSVADLSFNTA